MPKIFPLPRQQMLVLAVFGGVSPDPKQAPSPSLFSLTLTLICVSPHIGKLLCASTGCFWQLGVLEHNAVSRWYWWKSSVIFPFGAGTARCQVSRLFVFPLNPYGRLWLHVYDTWTYRGVFNHWSHGDTFIFTAERPPLRRRTTREDKNRFFAVLLWIILTPFSLRIVHWDR